MGDSLAAQQEGATWVVAQKASQKIREMLSFWATFS
jgi:hypothetical protein